MLSKKNPETPSYSLSVKRDRDKLMRTIGAKVLEFDIAPFSVGPMELENLFFKPPFFALCPFLIDVLDSTPIL
jgi:hypothetical protein